MRKIGPTAGKKKTLTLCTDNANHLDKHAQCCVGAVSNHSLGSRGFSYVLSEITGPKVDKRVKATRRERTGKS